MIKHYAGFLGINGIDIFGFDSAFGCVNLCRFKRQINGQVFVCLTAFINGTYFRANIYFFSKSLITIWKFTLLMFNMVFKLIYINDYLNT